MDVQLPLISLPNAPGNAFLLFLLDLYDDALDRSFLKVLLSKAAPWKSNKKRGLNRKSLNAMIEVLVEESIDLDLGTRRDGLTEHGLKCIYSRAGILKH